MPELRKDLVRNKWVVIATDRALRPNDFPINKQGLHNAAINGFCPFCEGNEDNTPPEIAAFRQPDTAPNEPGWIVRTIPNKFSAFELQGELSQQYSGIYNSCNGLGSHEVVIETPEHNVEFHNYTDNQIELILSMLKNRYNELAQDRRIKYIYIYKNRGLFGGASLAHSHSQVVGLPMVPQENYGIEEYYRRKGSCLICDTVKNEIEAKVRVVAETSNFLLICPYASRFSYETWIIPRSHVPHFGDITTTQIKELASLTKRFIAVMLDCLDNPSYNLMINTSPVNMDSNPACCHWYIEVAPRFIVTAGLEIGTGYYVNPVAPEISAALLRERLQQQGK
jgi:UDPglucose--hexose-1-phosphate uridylyltransferase